MSFQERSALHHIVRWNERNATQKYRSDIPFSGRPVHRFSLSSEPQNPLLSRHSWGLFLHRNDIHQSVVSVTSERLLRGARGIRFPELKGVHSYSSSFDCWYSTSYQQHHARFFVSRHRRLWSRFTAVATLLIRIKRRTIKEDRMRPVLKSLCLFHRSSNDRKNQAKAARKTKFTLYADIKKINTKIKNLN